MIILLILNSRGTETVKKEQYFSHIMTVILYLAQMKAACLEKGINVLNQIL